MTLSANQKSTMPQNTWRTAYSTNKWHFWEWSLAK